MPRGDKTSYTSKQKRQAHHIEESEEKLGRSSKTAARIAYATVNKQDGGGKKSECTPKLQVTHPSPSGQKKKLFKMKPQFLLEELCLCPKLKPCLQLFS